MIMEFSEEMNNKYGLFNISILNNSTFGIMNMTIIAPEDSTD